MTDLMTNVATASAQSTDLLIAVEDFAVLTSGDAGVTGDLTATDELDLYLQQLEWIGGLAGEGGYAGLQTLCLLLQDNLEGLRAHDGGMDEGLRNTMGLWPQLLYDYLMLPPGRGTIDAIVCHLHLPVWDPPLQAEDVEVVVTLLREERPPVTVEKHKTPVDLVSVMPGAAEVGTSADSVAQEAESKENFLGAAASPQGTPEATASPSTVFEGPLDEPSEKADTLFAPVQDVPGVEWGEMEQSSAAYDAAVGAEEPFDLDLKKDEAPMDDLDAPSERAKAPLAGYEKCHEVANGSAERPADFPSIVTTAEAQSAAPPEEAEAPAEVELPPEIAELVAMLLDELPLMDEALERLLQLELASEGVPEGRVDATEVYSDYLDRFAEAAETVGFAGLQQTVAHVQENLKLLAAQPRAFDASEAELLAAWSAYASIYLEAPFSGEACQGLLDWLAAPEWPRPIAAEEAPALRSLLQAPELPELEPEPEAEARPQQATAEDVSLALQDDVNPELLEALLQELPGQSQTFSEAVQNLIAGGSQDDVNVAQRMAHTLKGAGNTVGVYGLANLTHHLEDILVALAKQKALPTRALSTSLMNAADCLEGMGEALCGMGEAPDNAVEVMQEVLDWANRIDRDGLPEAEDEAPPPAIPEPQFIAESAAEPEVPHAEVAPTETAPTETAQPSQTAAPAATTRVAMELVDDLLRRGGETIILSGQVHEQVRRVDERIRAMHAEFERLQRLGGELERLIDIKDLSIDRRGPGVATEFDSLEMDQYSELHTTSRMLVEAATDASQIGSAVADQLRQLDNMLITQERLNRETQEAVFSARMVPIKTVVPRLQRSVRQTCRLTGKSVELHIGGVDTLMDGEVLNELIDPLMHVLRNAVDHGIESAERRVDAGKPASGNIRLDFLREGNNILVRCRDDGAGFDYAAIRDAAESRGLLEPGQQVSEDRLHELLLMPNFSSRVGVTQTSGRGVGLDVVHSHVLSQGGSLALKSESGKGSATELRLPASLISTHALLVRVRGQVMAVADRGIERILHAEDGERRMLGDKTAFQVDDLIYPLRELEDILRLPPDRRAAKRSAMPVLVVRERSTLTAVPVEEVLAGTDLVVKEFGSYVPRLPGMIGATILGDGAVTPVLDLPELMRGGRGQIAGLPSEAPVEAQQEGPPLPMALVVDDSLSARKALVLVMKDAGYEVREARDGMEAAQLAAAKRPDIVLADMEMPRMNGIELTAHLRARPETADLPVIMITSRSTEKHRNQAEAAGVNVYLTKPFSEDQLLEQVAVLGGQG